MRREVIFGVVLIILISAILSLNMVSASWFSDFFGKITGHSVKKDSSLLASYSFNDNIKDDATGRAGLNYGADFVEGKSGKALSFNGSGYASLAKPALNKLSTWVWSAWVYPSNSGAIYSEGSPDVTFILNVREDGSIKASIWNKNLAGNWVESVSPAGAVKLNEWNYITLVLESSVLKFYANRNFISSAPCQAENSNGVKYAVIGENVGAHFKGNQEKYSFIGKIDELKIWKRALSESEIKILYDSYLPAGTTIEPASVACTDSDGGKNYYVKGKSIEVDAVVEDYCKDNNTLSEGYCENGTVRNEEYNCSNGCRDGACLNSESESRFQTLVHSNLDFDSLIGYRGLQNLDENFPYGLNAVYYLTRTGTLERGRTFYKQNIGQVFPNRCSGEFAEITLKDGSKVKAYSKIIASYSRGWTYSDPAKLRANINYALKQNPIVTSKELDSEILGDGFCIEQQGILTLALFPNTIGYNQKVSKKFAGARWVSVSGARNLFSLNFTSFIYSSGEVLDIASEHHIYSINDIAKTAPVPHFFKYDEQVKVIIEHNYWQGDVYYVTQCFGKKKKFVSESGESLTGYQTMDYIRVVLLPNGAQNKEERANQDRDATHFCVPGTEAVNGIVLDNARWVKIK